jgi:hypothetical protein
MLRGARTPSPGASDWKTAAAAACPEEKSIAPAAFSRTAMSASAASYVGLSARE